MYVCVRHPSIVERHENGSRYPETGVSEHWELLHSWLCGVVVSIFNNSEIIAKMVDIPYITLEDKIYQDM